jgi:putative endonuclease
LTVERGQAIIDGIMSHADRTWYIYLLQCADGTLYTGVSLDPERRLHTHNAGRGARYTRTRLPTQLLGVRVAGRQREALLLERRIKRLSPQRKRAFFEAGVLGLPGGEKEQGK